MSRLSTEKMNEFLSAVCKADKIYDVAVVGGGTAGAFAAISAARSGAETVILERSSMLGGTSTNGGVNYPGLFHYKAKQIIDGPCWEAILRCEKLGGATIPEIINNPQDHWVNQIPTDIVIFNRVLEEMCIEAGVAVRYYSTVFAAKEMSYKGNEGVMLGVAGPDGAETIFVRKAIDATGDANLAAILGYDMVKSEILQPATIRNRLSGYDASKLDEELVNKMTEDAFASGELDRDSFWGWKVYSNLASYTLNTHIFGDDFSSSEGKTDLELRSRGILMKFMEFFRKIPGLENIKVSYMAPECGVRETYRIVGKTVMTVDKYVSGYIYPDAVCYAFYPVDLHQRGGINQDYGVQNNGNAPTVSYSALIPAKNGVPSDNVLAAGRCISTDRMTMSALRVEAPCMAEGQAAGVAAAICAKNDVKVSEIDFGILTDGLKKIGAIVPTQK